MAGFRSSFIHLCHPLAKLIPAKILLKVCDQPLILPVYHLVSDKAPSHIKHLYKIKRTDEFEADLDYLLHHFRPLSLLQLHDVITGKQRLERPSFFLSFDDGLSEFYHIVAPRLEQKGLGAINFLNSAFIDNRALFYRYKVSLIIEKIRSAEVALDLPIISQIMGRPVVDADQLILQLLTLRYRHTGQIDTLAQTLSIDFQDYLQTTKPYLSSDQITELQSRGFWFGGHSVDHPHFADLSVVEQRSQAMQSVDAIKKQFNPPLDTFAFPFTDYGVPQDFFADLYKPQGPLHLSFGSAGLKQDIRPQHLHRIPMEMKKLSAQSVIEAELLYFACKRLVGRNKIKRK